MPENNKKRSRSKKAVPAPPPSSGKQSSSTRLSKARRSPSTRRRTAKSAAMSSEQNRAKAQAARKATARREKAKVEPIDIESLTPQTAQSQTSATTPRAYAPSPLDSWDNTAGSLPLVRSFVDSLPVRRYSDHERKSMAVVLAIVAPLAIGLVVRLSEAVNTASPLAEQFSRIGAVQAAAGVAGGGVLFAVGLVAAAIWRMKPRYLTGAGAVLVGFVAFPLMAYQLNAGLVDVPNPTLGEMLFPTGWKFGWLMWLTVLWAPICLIGACADLWMRVQQPPTAEPATKNDSASPPSVGSTPSVGTPSVGTPSSGNDLDTPNPAAGGRFSSPFQSDD